MKTKQEQRFDLVCAALSGLCANAQPGIPASEYSKSAVSFADAAMKELEATVNESLTVDIDGWIPHRPGDPMPCDGASNPKLLFRDGEVYDLTSRGEPANDYDWCAIPWDPVSEIIAWKPAK